MQKLLKLQHHRHTGRKLHHRHTSYRALLLVLVLAAGCIVLLNKMAAAASYNVTAQILAPIPAGAPTINSPTSGSVYEATDVTIAGSCPVITPRVVVIIYEGSDAIGSQQCSALGTFAVPIALHLGSQSLVATVMTITNQAGGSSQPVVVSYRQLVENPTSGPVVIHRTPRGVQLDTLEIRSQSPFIVYGPLKPAEWSGSFAGGQLPYTASIAWGDGDVTWLRGAGNNPVRAQHTYDVIKPSYRIVITLRDSAGHDLQMRISAVSPATPTVGSLVAPSTSPPFSRFLYITYLLTLVVMLVLWAIEHRTAPRLAAVPIVARRKQPARKPSTSRNLTPRR